MLIHRQKAMLINFLIELIIINYISLINDIQPINDKRYKFIYDVMHRSPNKKIHYLIIEVAY